MSTLTAEVPPWVGDDSLRQLMRHIGTAARAAAQVLAQATADAKNTALRQAAANIRARSSDILAANEKDVATGRDKGLNAALLDRLGLSGRPDRGDVARSRGYRRASDPVGQVIAEWDRPNGLHIARVRTPLGVIGVIYDQGPTLPPTPAACA